MGGSDYAARAPPGSYIDVMDYNHPKELSRYLLHLDNNMDEYLEYFRWRGHYQVHTGHEERATNAMCRLCEMLNNNKEEKVYRTLGEWWWGGGACTKKGQFNWGRDKSTWGENVLRLFPGG